LVQTVKITGKTPKMTMIHERNRKTTTTPPTEAIIIADTTTAIVITTTTTIHQNMDMGTIGTGAVIDVGARRTTKMDSGCLRSSSSREGSRMGGRRRRMTLILGAGGVFRRRNASTSETSRNPGSGAHRALGARFPSASHPFRKNKK
jgi:hypothetical protein